MSQLCGHSIMYRIAVFVPISKHRALVTPTKRGKGGKLKAPDEAQGQTPAERRASMIPDQVRGRPWAQRLKRVFNIDIETCRECVVVVKVIACIEDLVVTQKILNLLKEKGKYQNAFRLPESRDPPQTCLLR